MSDEKVILKPVISLDKKRADKELMDKVDKYYHYLSTYGYETASMWTMDNVAIEEVDEFKAALHESRTKYGF